MSVQLQGIVQVFTVVISPDINTFPYVSISSQIRDKAVAGDISHLQFCISFTAWLRKSCP